MSTQIQTWCYANYPLESCCLLRVILRLSKPQAKARATPIRPQNPRNPFNPTNSWFRQKARPTCVSRASRCVRAGRFELPHPKAPPPQDGVSTSFTTCAVGSKDASRKISKQLPASLRRRSGHKSTGLRAAVQADGALFRFSAPDVLFTTIASASFSAIKKAPDVIGSLSKSWYFRKKAYSAFASGESTKCSEMNHTCNSLVRITLLTSKSLVPSSPDSSARLA